MVAKHYYRNDDGDLELVPTVLRWGWTLGEKSEEGEKAVVSVIVDDPDMALEFVAWRRWIVREDESESDDDVIFSGFVGGQTIAHAGGEITEPAGRVWVLELVDMNTLWEQRLMVGADTRRPSETDVARLEWLVATEEMGYFSDTSLISSASPVTMDKRNVAGQTPKQIVDECAQDTGKNYWIGARDDGIFVWYGKDSLTAYASPLTLTNDPAVLDMAAVDDGTATTYPLGKVTELKRSGERIYSGVLVEWEKGRWYKKDADTLAAFTLSGRDLSHPAPEIKTIAAAKRRALRLLADHNSQDLRITTTITLPASKATMLRTGMTVPITGTHLTDGFADGKICRILSTAPKPIAGGRKYEIAIEAIPVRDAPSCSLAVSTIEHVGAEGAFAAAPVTSTLVPSFDALVLAFQLACNPNTPSSTAMTTPSGYTARHSQSTIGSSTFVVASKAVAAGASSSPSSTYTPGFGSFGEWASYQIAIATGETSPVQEKYAAGIGATFDATPTPGNLWVLFMHASTFGGSVTTPAGFTEVFHYTDGPSDSEMAVAVRCVEVGDSPILTWANGGGGSTLACATYMSEWEIT